MAARFPIPTFGEVRPELAEFMQLMKRRRKSDGKSDAKTFEREIRKYRRAARQAQAQRLTATVARATFTETPLRERVTRFWADHFTVEGKNGILKNAVSTYVEEAIRPNVTGTFAELLTAAVTHPMMLIYLDQVGSVGTGSPVARRKGRGLNENLAREVLELHTLGVGGSYTQADVRELAELFTGLSFDPRRGFLFRPAMAAPGAETVLGKRYGGGRPDIAHIKDFLSDIAAHPETARHIALKLSRHFVSDDPDPALVTFLEGRFNDTRGNLMAVYQGLLEYPAAWKMPDSKIKQPFDFVTSSLRALGVTQDRIGNLKPREAGLFLALPMQIMGQPWENPQGPDGWPEETAAWITPQGVAGRIQWAMTVPRAARNDLPDPREFLDTALGSRASDALRFAAAGAETKWEGVGLILASPEFQRR